MKSKWIAGLIFTCGISLATQVFAADFGKIPTSYRFAKLVVTRPAGELLRGRTLAVTNKPAVPYAAIPALQAGIVQALSTEFAAANDKPELTLSFSVAAYTAPAGRYTTATELREVGAKGPPIIRGIPIPTGKVEMKNVPVQYWETSGNLELQVWVFNQTGNQVDTFAAKAKYEDKIETAANGVPTKAALPNPQELNNTLMKLAIFEIQKRYTKTTETINLRLATPDPLKAGIALAERGQWKEALAQWTSVRPGNNQAERSFNMALANEALFYATDFITDPAAGEATMQEAIRLYEEAFRLDPGEKFFKLAIDRSNDMKANLGRAKEQLAIRERDTEMVAAATDATRSLEEDRLRQSKDLTSTRPDTADEAEFRETVRIRLRGQTAKPAADYIANLEKNGVATYKLDPNASKRVVTQEVTRWEEQRQTLGDYRMMFADLVKDKVIDAKEREVLDRMAARSNLSKEDVSKVESEFQFTDVTRAAPATKPDAGTTRPPATKTKAAPAAPTKAPAATSGSTIKKP